MTTIKKSIERIISQGILLKGNKAPKFDLGTYFWIAFKLILIAFAGAVVAGTIGWITGFSFDTAITAIGSNIPASTAGTTGGFLAILGTAFSLVFLKTVALSLIISFATVLAMGWLMKRFFKGIPAKAHPIMVALNVSMLGVITALFGGIGIVFLPYLVQWLLGWE